MIERHDQTMYSTALLYSYSLNIFFFIKRNTNDFAAHVAYRGEVEHFCRLFIWVSLKDSNRANSANNAPIALEKLNPARPLQLLG
jgi:hypothetical protein